MSEHRLAVLIPTRGRPGNIAKVIEAWNFTGAWDHADMILIADADDPEYPGYVDLANWTREKLIGLTLVTVGEWMPMVHKLNRVAQSAAYGRQYFALGFAGDDHVPQTMNWARRYLDVLDELKTGMVFGDDGYQGANLSTEWAVTADAVRALDRMVPADVEHMYCDNSIMDLFSAAGALRHLPEVRIEHMHPIVKKAPTDAQYQRVNHRDQFKKDKAAYEGWRYGDIFLKDVAEIRHLRPGLAEVRPEPEVRRKDGTDPAPGPRRGQVSTRKSGRRAPYPRHFRLARGATPDDILMTIADFASMVPADEEIVELGVFQGRSSLVMAWGARQGNGAHVTGIDPWDLPGNVYDPPFTDPGSESWARYWVQSQGYGDRISLIKAFSHDVASWWSNPIVQPKVGLLFVDGDHTKEGARRDIEAWAPHLAEGARIAVDDYGHPDWPGVGQAVDELVAEGVLAPIEVFHDRLAVTRLAGKDGAPAPSQGAPGAASSDEPEATDDGPAATAPSLQAITSEGVSPSPYPAVSGQVAVPVELPVVVDTEPSTDLTIVQGDEAGAVGLPEGTSIEALNTFQLRALARSRGIRLGARKDLRESMLAALREGV